MSSPANTDRPVMKSCAVMGLPPPMVKFPRTLISELPQPSKNQGLIEDQGNPKHTNSLQLVGPRWIIADGSTPELPFLYPLQETHVIVSLSPAVIAANIEDCLRELSIQATFDNNRTIAHCQTMHHVKFDIYLYKGSTERNETIVELNRVSSARLGFHDIKLAVLQAAKGEEYAKGEKYSTETLYAKPLPCLDLDDEKEDSEGICETALAQANTMLSKERYDANKLGMESMVFLTDRRKTKRDLAFRVAKAVLCCDDKNFEESRLKIYNLVVYGKMTREKSDEYYYDDDGCRYLENHFKQMRRDAMNVLLNSLDTITYCCNDLESVSSTSTWFGYELATVLLQDLKNAYFSPHDAHLAAKCINALVKCDEFRNRIMSMNDAHNVLENAAITGRCYHQLLANESNLVLQAFKCN